MLSRREFLGKTATMTKGAALTGLAGVVASCSDSKPIQRKERSAELLDLKVNWYEYTDKRNLSNPVVYRSSLHEDLTGVEVMEGGIRIHYYKVPDETDALNANSGGVNFRGEFVPPSTDRFAVPRNSEFWIKFNDNFKEVLDAYNRQ